MALELFCTVDWNWNFKVNSDFYEVNIVKTYPCELPEILARLRLRYKQPFASICSKNLGGILLFQLRLIFLHKDSSWLTFWNLLQVLAHRPRSFMSKYFKTFNITSSGNFSKFSHIDLLAWCSRFESIPTARRFMISSSGISSNFRSLGYLMDWPPVLWHFF